MGREPSVQVQGSDAGGVRLITELRARGRLLWREEFVAEGDVAAYFCASDAVACPYPACFSVSSGTATRAAAALASTTRVAGPSRPSSTPNTIAALASAPSA